MKLTKSHIALCIACMIAGVLLGAGFRSCGHEQPRAEPIILHDTITRTDTIIETRTRTLRIDSTAYVFVRDTATVTDTIYLPCEWKEYRDSIVTDTSNINWSVKYHGYDAHIDSFGLNYKFTTNPRIEVKKRGFGQFVGIGIGAGYGVSVINNQVFAAPSVGVHITYGWGYHW